MNALDMFLLFLLICQVLLTFVLPDDAVAPFNILMLAFWVSILVYNIVSMV